MGGSVRHLCCMCLLPGELGALLARYLSALLGWFQAVAYLHVLPVPWSLVLPLVRAVGCLGRGHCHSPCPPALAMRLLLCCPARRTESPWSELCAPPSLPSCGLCWLPCSSCCPSTRSHWLRGCRSACLCWAVGSSTSKKDAFRVPPSLLQRGMGSVRRTSLLCSASGSL